MKFDGFFGSSMECGQYYKKSFSVNMKPYIIQKKLKNPLGFAFKAKSTHNVQWKYKL